MVAVLSLFVIAISVSFSLFMLSYTCTLKVRGLSKIAGVSGVAQTAVTRCMLVPCACLILPGLIMNMLKKRRLLPAGASSLIVVEMAIIYSSLQVAMPAALAVFPQVQSAHALYF
jgi:Sideroflexins